MFISQITYDMYEILIRFTAVNYNRISRSIDFTHVEKDYHLLLRSLTKLNSFYESIKPSRSNNLQS